MYRILFLFFIFSVHTVHAQLHVEGTVVDANNQPVKRRVLNALQVELKLKGLLSYPTILLRQ